MRDEITLREGILVVLEESKFIEVTEFLGEGILRFTRITVHYGLKAVTSVTDIRDTLNVEPVRLSVRVRVIGVREHNMSVNEIHEKVKPSLEGESKLRPVEQDCHMSDKRHTYPVLPSGKRRTESAKHWRMVQGK